MNIVKHLKDSSSQRIQKKRFPYYIKNNSDLISAMLLASLLGTYLDLFFVGIGIYAFPKRVMPDIFSINVPFTLIGLPLLIGVFLYVCNKVNAWQKAGIILLLSLLMSVFEKIAEGLGLFVHDDSWKHLYSFVGYTLYLTFIYFFYYWRKST